MLAYVHKYLCYSAEQSLKRNEVSAAVTGNARARVLSLIQYFVLLLIINPFNDILKYPPRCGLFSSVLRYSFRKLNS